MLYFNKIEVKWVLIYCNPSENKTHSLETLSQPRAIFICPLPRTKETSSEKKLTPLPDEVTRKK